MLLALTSEQEMFCDVTSRFVEEHSPVGRIRRLRNDPVGFDRDEWVRGAELGWTSLLVDPASGGGSLSGRPVVDLSLLAYEFGRHAAPGPLVTTNLAAAALTGSGAHAEVLAGLLDGSRIAAWCYSEPRPRSGLVPLGLEITPDGDDLVVHGVKRPVESADQADHFVVVGRTGSGTTQVVVPAGTDGVSVRRLESVDLTKRFSEIHFDHVRVPATMAVGEVGSAGPAIDHLFAVALVTVSSEAVGAMQAAFDMTVAWAFDRYSFGRPLASYQALKHRFADMKSWLEGSHAISDRAAGAVDAGDADAAELASAAKAYIGQFGLELMHECVQLHGGIGVTFEHDLHLFLRRATLNRTLFGTPADHRQRVADCVTAAVGAA